MKLSILIRTINGREEKFNSLIESLLMQGDFIEIEKGWADYKQGAEILWEKDNRELSNGAKAQLLLKRATGTLVSFIDDDDSVHFNYISKMIQGVDKGVDCIGFKVNLTGWETYPILCDVSNKWDTWAENMGGFKYVRCPNHIAGVNRLYSLQIGYNDIRHGEDADFSLRLKASGLIKTEHYIDEIMYEYKYDRNKK